MQGAKPPNNFRAVHRHHFTTGKTLADNATGFGIATFLLEGRHQDGVIDDEKIGITRGHHLILDDEWLWHGKRYDFQRPAPHGGEALQSFEVLREDTMIRTPAILLHTGYDTIGAEEAGDIVDVAIGIVAFDAIAQPKDPAHAKGVC